MDELTETLAVSFQVSNFPNSPHAPHPRFSQYKIKKNNNQEQRRKRLLALQKSRRHNYLHHVRGLAEGNWSEQLSDEADEDSIPKTETKEVLKELKKEQAEEPMELKRGQNDSSPKLTNEVKEEPMDLIMQQVAKPPKSYKNQLMLSEWLVEIPTDMAANWLLLLCPVGKRCLVVTANGSTRAYTKSGYCVNNFPSYLPGGNKHQQQSFFAKDYTILDCIFSDTDRTFYVLDLMCWRGHSVFNSETEFRFYWLNTKLEEVPEVKQHSSRNPFRFLALPHYKCSAAELEMVMWLPLPFSQPLDGLLFYNKETHYMHGPTPLVGWLKAYMLPELLGIRVPDNYLSERPSNYTCVEQHLKGTSRKKGRRKEQPMQTDYSKEQLTQTEVELAETEMAAEPAGDNCSEPTVKTPARNKKKKKRKRNRRKEQSMQVEVLVADDVLHELTD